MQEIEIKITIDVDEEDFNKRYLYNDIKAAVEERTGHTIKDLEIEDLD